MTFALLACGLIGAERYRRQSRLIESGEIPLLCQTSGGGTSNERQIAIGVCDHLAAPVLIGVIRPMILLPPAALNGWTIEQLEMVLWHELAHLRRWDNLVNLLQRVVESLLFFQPAVWWVSALGTPGARALLRPDGCRENRPPTSLCRDTRRSGRMPGLAAHRSRWRWPKARSLSA